MEDTYTITGTCRYCGQIATLSAEEDLEGSAADKYVSARCTCEAARRYRRGQIVCDNIELLFGDGCEDDGFTPEDGEVLTQLQILADAVRGGSLIEATVKTPCGDTCKIKVDREGELAILRTLKRTRMM